MKPTILILMLLCGITLSYSQTPTDIYLFDVSMKKDKITLSHPVNITNHKGYDNQPSFHPNLPLVYYSSFNDDGRADIKSYNYKTQQTVSITKTSEREYSPLVTPEKQYVSCIIQRDNGAQDLGKYPIDGSGEPSIIIDNMIIGYHVWTDNSHLGLFVLGEPHTLHYLLLPMKRDTVIASNIGRSLHRIPNETAFSFVQKNDGKDWQIMKFNTRTKKISLIGPAITSREDLCWTPDGRILMSDGPKIFYMKPGEAGWTEVLVNAGASILKDVTRLAISPDGKKLAVVVSE